MLYYLPEAWGPKLNESEYTYVLFLVNALFLEFGAPGTLSVRFNLTKLGKLESTSQ